MIITKKKDIGAVIKSLEGFKNVYLFGCDTCAEQCKTGGEAELKEMGEALTAAGFNVTGSSLVDETCYFQLARKEYRQQEKLREADAVLVLACGAGVKCVADAAPAGQPVLPALDSQYLAKVERVGHFFEGCSLCGDCVLAETAAICPHTECPKSLLNGPCGGVADGKCEVDMNNDCAWVRIYERLKIQNRLGVLEKTAQPKDHSGKTKPKKTILPR